MSISISIVSHGQSEFVKLLLQDLARLIDRNIEVLLTFNIPENLSFLENFEDLSITVIENAVPKGFGENHNAAFSLSSSDIFIIANPDIRLEGFLLEPLLHVCKKEEVAICAPLVRSNRGLVEDSARVFPTIPSLIGRKVKGRTGIDYEWGSKPIEVDWVAGMFMVFPREIYVLLGGFDEKYFLYMEDVDICRRAGMLGYCVCLVPESSIVHDAQRDSGKRLRYAYWHFKSALRYFFRYGFFRSHSSD